MAHDVLIVPEQEVIVIGDAQQTVLREEVPVTQVVAVAMQGPRGIQGPPGPAGGASTVTVGASPLSGHSAVAIDASGLLVPADVSLSAHRGAIVGVVANAYSPGDEAVVQTGYLLEHSGWSWVLGPVFVGAVGALTQAPPSNALFAQVIGYAVSPTRIVVDVQPPINLA